MASDMGILDSLLTHYGYWGGRGWSDGKEWEGRLSPDMNYERYRDALDKACMKHDMA